MYQLIIRTETQLDKIAVTIMKKFEKITGFSFSGSGHYKITIEFRGKSYSAITTNMPDMDLFRSDDKGWKGAGGRLYDEVVRKNNLR